jgi:hypothetical protein
VPSTAPIRRQGIKGTRNRPASVNGQARRSAKQKRGIKPASLRRGRPRETIQPAKMVPDDSPAQRFAAAIAPAVGLITVAYSTRGPIIWSGMR